MDLYPASKRRLRRLANLLTKTGPAPGRRDLRSKRQLSRFARGVALVAVTAFSGDAAAVSTLASNVLVGAGEIATCNTDNDELTARRIDAVDGTVFTLGNNAWLRGTLDEFDNCYDPTWGRHRNRTRAAAGDRDFLTPRAQGLFAYFDGTAGAPPPGWYSYDTAGWHVIVLNSALPITKESPQLGWLNADLDSHRNDCTVAMWNHPRFSSGRGAPGFAKTAPFFDAAYAGGVDIVLNAHETWYERFAPLDPSGTEEPNGIRQFVVGTGGVALQGPEGGTPIHPASVIRNATSRGVVRLELRPGEYEWDFLAAEGEPFTDTGIGKCHAGPRDLPLAVDGFERTRDDGWGNAQIGGPWTTTNKTDFTIDGSVGTVGLSPELNSVSARLERVTARSVRVEATMGIDTTPAGGGAYSSVLLRRVSPGNEYRAQLRRRADGSVTLTLTRIVNRVTTQLMDETIVPGVSAVDPIRVSAEISGANPTAMRARATALSDLASTNWLVSTTDRTKVLQARGTVGWSAFIARADARRQSVRMTVDDFRAVRIATIPELPLANDSFGRTVENGWGVAEAGGPWGTGNPATFSVIDDHGVAKLDRGNNRSIRLTNVRVLTANVAATLSADKISRGSDQFTSIVLRRVSERTEYRVRVRRGVDGHVLLAITRVINGSETLLTTETEVPGASTVRSVRVVAQIRGRSPTTIRARAYDIGATDSFRWMIQATDRATPLQVEGTLGWAGSIERDAKNAPVQFVVDDFIAAVPPRRATTAEDDNG